MTYKLTEKEQVKDVTPLLLMALYGLSVSLLVAIAILYFIGGC